MATIDFNVFSVHELLNFFQKGLLTSDDILLVQDIIFRKIVFDYDLLNPEYMPLYDALQKTVNEIVTKKSATLLQQGTGPGYLYSEPSTSTANQSEFYETVDQTRSSGAVEKFKYFNLRGEGTREIKKFKAQSRYINFNFKSVNEEETNPIVWLQNAFDELLGYIMNRMEPSDRVGMTLRNQNYPDKPVGFSFRRADQYSTEVVINIISNIMQSNADFFTRDMMTLQVDRVSLPVGKRRTNLTGSSFDEFCRKKHGIIEINNKDNLCLAYALVLAIAFKLNNSELKEMRRGSNILKQRSRQLCLRANVDLANGGGYDEIDRFQNYLTNFTIVVYNSRLGKTTYYEGPRTESRTVLNLLMEDGHYATITSLTSAFTTSYFCELCKNRTSNKVGHANCHYKCPCCQKNPPCNIAEQKLLCVICNRDFRGVECFNNHKKKLCSILRRCKECSASFWSNKKQNHICGQKMCRVCMKIQPIRHLCYISKNNKKKSSEAEQKFLLIFYDFEWRQETPVSGVMNGFLHEPNLCISQHVCYKCFNDDSVKGSCQNCGSRVHVFKEKPVDSFLQYIALMAKNFKVTALAHNMRGYDGCFILKNIIQNRSKWNPKLITNGTKLISITCNKIRFLDSLNFLPLPLSKLPQTFNFPGSKGYFPYLFNTLENQNYVGEIPEVHYYCPDQLNSKDREALLIWHANQKLDRVQFDMNKEIVDYCFQDVDILRKSCIAFWKMFKQENDVDIFQEATTIASGCNLVFRRRFLKENTIGIVPPGGYRLGDKQSNIAIKWLLWMEFSLSINIQHAGNNREVRLPQNILVDGFCKDNNTVYEFYGCFYHGCENCYFDQTVTISGSDQQRDEPVDNKKDDEAMFMKREQTEARAKRIRTYGYNLVEIWQCEFDKFLKFNEEARNYLENQEVLKYEPLNPREGFFGGRTNAVKLYHKCQNENEQICYYDVCSLYPYVNKYSKYPVGHPTIHVGHEACNQLNINTVEGIIKCTVLPPLKLYHPVLPYRMHKKLMFILCRTCGETLNQSDCTHNDSQRQFTGTFVADELRYALSLGYKITLFHEIWEYIVDQYDLKSKSGGLFAEYVDNFLRLKQECSDFPSWCKTDKDKERYIDEYFLREGVRLRKDHIQNNPGLRFIAKLMLNSFWGKFGQRDNLMQTSIISEPHSLFKILTDPFREVHSIILIDDDTVIVNWDRPDEGIVPLKTTNVAIAAYTTANARLELYKYLEQLGENVLYYDTDSVIFKHSKGEWIPPTGDFLGQLTNELEQYGEGSKITEFVSGGPKNYGYNIYSTNKQRDITVCKVKGLTLNFENSKVVNFETMKNIICDGSETVYVNNDRKIVRTSAYDVLSRPEKKKYQLSYTKRRRIPDSYDTLPYGYRD